LAYPYNGKILRTVELPKESSHPEDFAHLS